jgi:hypothetical protein
MQWVKAESGGIFLIRSLSHQKTLFEIHPLGWDFDSKKSELTTFPSQIERMRFYISQVATGKQFGTLLLPLICSLENVGNVYKTGVKES